MSTMTTPTPPTPRNYTVYRNDLKYKKNRNVDTTKALWDDARLRDMFEEVDLDSLDYRLYECRRSGMRNLDLNNMDLVTFPEISAEYSDNVRCLFLAENDLEILPDLTAFKRLEILEVGNNGLREMGLLPASLIELTCRGNHLSRLPDADECPRLQRVDCTGNEILEIPRYRSLRSLLCSQNRLQAIPDLENLERLVCCDNRITYLGECSRLRYLDCGQNRLTTLPDYRSLVDLICSNNPLPGIPAYVGVRYLEIFGTPIREVPYLPKLEELFCDRDVRGISTRYEEECNMEGKVHKDRMVQITFTKKRA